MTFVELVRAMRKKQKDYFRTRDRVVLEESKRLEHEVDVALARDKDGPSLFPEEAPK